MDQDLRVRQRHALAVRAAGQQQRAHRHRDADADRLHVGLDELHRVVDRQARVDRAAGRVDVQRDVLLGVLGLQMQQLRDDEVRDLVVDGRAEEDDPLVEQAAVDVERALPAGGLLDDHRDQWAHGPRFVSLRPAGFLQRHVSRRASPLAVRCDRPAIQASGPASTVPPASRGASGAAPARRPSSRARSAALLRGRPQLLARARLLERDRLGGLRDQLDRAPRGEIVAQLLEAPGVAQSLAAASRAATCSRSAAAASASSSSSSLGSISSACTTAVSTASRRSARSASGASSARISCSSLPVMPQVGLARDAAVGERVQDALPHLARARLDQRSGHLHLAPERPPRRARPRGTPARPWPLLGLEQAPADVLAQLVDRVEAGVDREVVVDLGELLALDLLDRHLEACRAAGELGARVVGREGQLERALLAGAGARRAPRSKPAIRLPEPSSISWSRPAPPSNGSACRLRSTSEPSVVDDDEVALRGGTLDRLQARETVAQLVDLALDLLVGDRGLGAADLQPRYSPSVGLRQHADLEGELQARPRSGAARRASRSGSPTGAMPVVSQRVDVPGAERVAHGLLEHGLAPDALDHERRRHLAAAKAGELQCAPRARAPCARCSARARRREP